MMTANKEEGEEACKDLKTPSMSQAGANNNLHNSQRHVVDGIVNQGADSAMFSLSMAPPEVPSRAGQFPVARECSSFGFSSPMNQQKYEQENVTNHLAPNANHRQFLYPVQAENFPIHQKIKEIQRFPLDVWEKPTTKQGNQKITENQSLIQYHRFPSMTIVQNPSSPLQLFSLTNLGLHFLPIYQVYAPSFPLHHVHAPLGHIFPDLNQLPRKMSGDDFPQISTTMTRRNQVASSPAAKTTKEFPVIKKRFVTSRSFPNYRALAGDGDDDVDDGDGDGDYHNDDDGWTGGPPSAPPQQTTTMTQTRRDKDTEIDQQGGSDGIDDVRVQKAFDNELEATALNLNAMALVLVAKEIEHQQAENFNDAFGGGQRHDHKSRIRISRISNRIDDAMDVAKNKHEICEQSKLEKAEDDHNELNMTKLARVSENSQSICLTREQTIDGNGYGDGDGDRRITNHLSDARDPSPEQVDVLTRERNPHTNPSSETRPNIELLKTSVRALLDNRFQLNWDWELLDLLTEAIEFICREAETGNLWSETVVGADDMTVTKVSEERDSETVLDADPLEQLDQQQQPQLQEVDDNNNNSPTSEPNPIEMKYELKTVTPTATTALPSRRSFRSETPPSIPSIPSIPTSSLGTTSRIRNVEGITSTPAPLLGELKRSSSSRDDISIDTDSLLPERTRLRRQRRMRSQDSVEEKPEDVIERLNKLKARISGALSEVKSVIKQYSTEGEAEASGELAPEGLAQASGAGQLKPVAPVAFRFVKKVRRRSYFDEAEEEKLKEDQEKHKDEQEKDTKVQENKKETTSQELKDHKIIREQTPFPKEEPALTDQKESKENEKLEEKHKEKTENKRKSFQLHHNEGKVMNETQEALAENNEKSQENKDMEIREPKVLKDQENQEPKDAESLKIKGNKKQDPEDLKNQEKQEPNIQYQENDGKAPQSTMGTTISVQESTTKDHPKESAEIKAPEPPKINGDLTQQEKQSLTTEKSKAQVKIEFLAKVQSELKSKSAKEKASKEAKEATTSAEKKQPEPSPVDLQEEKQPKPSVVDLKEEKQPEPQSVDVKDDKQPQDPTIDTQNESPAMQPSAKIKKKIVVKAKNPRRASIAAVEPSKIKVEPAVEQSDALIIQRRPSDSEAIVKRKKKPKLMGAIADASLDATPTTSARPRETDELVAVPEVGAVPAKLSAAKSGQGEAATTLATTATPAAAPTISIIEPPTCEIDGNSLSINQAPSAERGSRVSLKLEEELLGVVAAASPQADPESGAQPPSPHPESKELINQRQSQVLATPQQVAIGADIAPQIAATLRHEESSPERPLEATKVPAHASPGDSREATMPELKVLSGPVQPVKIETVEEPHDLAKNDPQLVKKKAAPHLKKLLRKNSIDKRDKDVVLVQKTEQQKQDSSKLSNILRDRNKINELTTRISKLTPPKKQVKQKEEPKQEKAEEKPEEKPADEAPANEASSETQPETETETEPATEPESEPVPVPKKPRKVKKKVIIKRQKRRLSIGDTFFLQPEPEEPKIPEIETIERAIAYVTDDEEDTKASEEEKPEPPAPLKSCLHVKEYKIGDLVLYAERYRKTQVRWKRGRVLERITSISYKLEIEGKEVPAHVSYIKKYTGRKVRFGGKEYLEIDYEQVAEEERRAASYSIWNMV
ncbi:hypothetical protein KR009_005456 [Drosophila setifemur]|nr:hypothetical protein KR009_005456 [Drosophila setifemur]